MTNAFEYINMLFGGLIGWLNQIFNSIPGSIGWVLAVFAMYSSFRFLIFPLVGGRTIGGSDKAKKSGSKNNSDSTDDSKTD